MPLKVYKEVHVDGTKFILGPDRLVIQYGEDASNSIHLSLEDTKELTRWLGQELLQQNELPPSYSAEFVQKVPGVVKDNKKTAAELKKLEPPCTYQPRTDPAVQTVELKIGDPNLAYRGFAGRAPGDGQTAVTDLGAMHGKAVIS